MRAYCLDLDGTLTTLEVLPCIAAELGLAEEIGTLTRATMDGVISFPESLRLRAAVLGSVPIEQVHRLLLEIPLNTQMVEFVSSCPDQCFVVTGNLDLWVAPLIERLGCRAYASQAVVDGPRLRVIEVLDKATAITDIRSRGFSEIVAIGDGANDAPMLRAADIAIAFGGVHSPARSAISESQFVLHDGGELCRLLAGL